MPNTMDFDTWDAMAQDVQKSKQFNAQPDDKSKAMFMTQVQRRWLDDHRAAAKGPDLPTKIRPDYSSGDMPAPTGPLTKTPPITLGGKPPEAGTGDAGDQPDWYTRNVGRPLLRGTEAGLAGLFKGPNAMEDAYHNPGKYPRIRGLARTVPILGSESPGQMGVDSVMTALWATGIGEAMEGYSLAAKLAPEGSKFIAPAMRMAERVSIPMFAGAGANYAFTRSKLQAAEAGAGGLAQGLGGEALSFLTRTSASGLAKLDMRNISEWVETYLPDVIKEYGKLAKTQIFDKVFRTSSKSDITGEAVSGAVKVTENELARIEQRMSTRIPDDTPITLQIPPDVRAHVNVPGENISRPPKPGREAVPPDPGRPEIKGKPTRDPKTGRMRPAEITQFKKLPFAGRPAIPPDPGVPEGTYKMTFKEARGLLDQVRSIGWNFKGDLALNKIGMMMRQFAGEAEKEVAMAASQIDAHTAGQWVEGRYRRNLAKTLSNMLSEPGVIKGGRVVNSELQKVALGEGNLGYRADLIQLMGEEPANKFFKVLLHGDSPGAAEDIAGQFSPSYRLHPGAGLLTGHGGGFGLIGGSILGHPTLPYRSGTPPLDVGRGAMWAIYTLGPWGVMRAIMSSMGFDDDSYAPDDNIIRKSN